MAQTDEEAKKIRPVPDLLKTGGVDETRTHDPHTASVVL